MKKGSRKQKTLVIKAFAVYGKVVVGDELKTRKLSRNYHTRSAAEEFAKLCSAIDVFVKDIRGHDDLASYEIISA
jgi:hypothetical protein